MSIGNDCGATLRDWRKKRRYSQLQLATEAGVSSRHLSFIETGRSVPSKNMILQLQQFLDLPRTELNRVLRFAGHPPVYLQLPDEHKDLQPIYQAIDRIIEKQMPYPAIVLDQHWNVVRANTAMMELFSTIGLAGHTNLVDAMVSDSFDRSFITNYNEVINLLTYRVRSEKSHNGGDAKLAELEEKLTSVNCNTEDEPADNGIVLTVKFNIHGQALNIFSTITELGAVQDVAVGCFKIELMFPLDDETEQYFAIKNQNLEHNK